MELNEIKSQLAGLMNFSKINMGAGSGGDAFAQMLALDSEVKQPEPREDASAQVMAKNRRAEADDTRPDDKSKVVDKKTKSAKKDIRKASAKNDVPDDNVAALPRENTQPQPNEKNSRAENKKIIAEETSVAEAPTAQPQSENANNKMSEPETFVEVSLSDLSLMGMINVINPSTGETMSVYGADLAAQLAGNDSLTVMMSASQNEAPLFKIQPVAAEQTSASLQAANADTGIDISALSLPDDVVEAEVEVVEPQANVAKKAAAATDFAEETVDDKINEQAAKLAEAIGQDKRADLKVSVQEEKIAQLSTKDLLVNAKSVDEAITISSKPAEVSAANSAETISQPKNQPSTDNLAQNLNAAPLFNAETPVAAEANLAVRGAISNADNASVSFETATVAGSEFARASRTDAASENSQTSFRDVYKGMSKEVVEQIKVNITKSAVKGVDKINISLKPEELGHIEIKMQIGRDGKLQAHIISTRPETMETLQKEMQSLEKAFNDAGFQTDEGSLSFSFRDGNQANQNQEKENGLRRFIGDIFEKEASNDFMGDAAQNQSWNGVTGLNIRV